MINRENMQKLYDLIIAGQELTTKELLKIGFNSKDLTYLVEEGTLSRYQRGYYFFNKIDDLYCAFSSLSVFIQNFN